MYGLTGFQVQKYFFFMIFDIIKVIGCLALLMFGMKTMSEGLQKFAGESLRKVLGREDVSFIICKEGQVKEDIMVFPGCISTFVENSYKHAFPPEIGKPEIVVKLFCSEGSLIISVRDNGCGFDPDLAPGIAQGHFGLQGIAERLERLNGEMKIDSTPGKGAKVTVVLPIPCSEN